MDYPIASVRSVAPAAMLARYFRKIDDVSSVVIHGIENDFGLDVSFMECAFYIDRQLGFVQLFVKDKQCNKKSIALFVPHFNAIPKGFFSSLLSMVPQIKRVARKL